MNARRLKTWAWIHKWSSLVCTVFMLLLCLTGLPLIFHHEIGHLLGTEIEAPAMPADTPKANLDEVLQAARAFYPGKVPLFGAREEEEGNLWFFTFGDTVDDQKAKTVAVDARTAEVVRENEFTGGFMWVMFKLHVDLFAGLAGKLFLGLMGLLLLVAIVSGVVLYAPFMRKLDFGEVRRDRSARVKWLDLHNLLGIVTLVWALVVGATGMINTWADLMIKYWQFTELGHILEPYQGKTAPTELGSFDAAVKGASAAHPGMRVDFIAFPGTQFSSPFHYAVFLRGNEPLTSRLLTPVLMDAVTARHDQSVDLPWYLKALLVSQPLHFGDYGGMPMKILWALLDLATIVVLGSGLYLWLARRGRPQELARELAAVADPAIPPVSIPSPSTEPARASQEH
ncbi:MAG: PepSY domain-containing protein [Rhizobacter sp.]